MSEATATATAIPREINLGLQKPVATPAYTRRFKSQAQTIESTAGTQATITLDTAQPGSFIDTLDSYLSFTLRLTNTTEKGYNVSFSSCGAQGLIRAMRIYVQGVPIEEITEYNALVEWLHDLSGIPDYCDRSAKSRYLANTLNDDYFVYLPPKAAGTSESYKEIAVQLPLISGVLGTMADKMFPSMLVAPGNCYIQLDLATAQNALRIQEVDVSNLLVGTGGTGTANNNTYPPVVAATIAAVTAFNSSLVDFRGANQGGVTVTADSILGERPYDAPFAGSKTDTYGSITQTGVLTTEERIGGGVFGPSTSQPGAATSELKTLFMGKSMASYSDAGVVGDCEVVSTSTASTNPNAAVFLGSGVASSANSLMSGTSKKMNTDLASNAVTYSVRNLEYVGKQVVVGDDVARAIIERAAAGDISIHTQSYRQYSTTIPLNAWAYRADPAYAGLPTPVAGNPMTNYVQRYQSGVTQSIVIPAKISSANAIYHIFRNGVGIEDFQFDSLRRMTVGFSDWSAGATAQLRIGNELIPQSPIQSASEALEELLKAHHMDGFYGTCEKMGSIVASSGTLTWPQATTLLTSRGANNTGNTLIPRDYGMDIATTALLTYGGDAILRNDFNSQILCPNPDSVTFKYRPFAIGAYVREFFSGQLGTGIADTTDGIAHAFYRATETAGCHAMSHATAGVTQYFDETGLEYANRQNKFKLAVRKAFFGYADERSEHQIVDPKRMNFMHPLKQHTGRYSTFMLGFDLDTFSHNSETIRSGHYLGNNTVSLNLTNAEFIDNSPLNQALCNSVRMDTYVLHDLRLSFQAGGIVQAFY